MGKETWKTKNFIAVKLSLEATVSKNLDMVFCCCLIVNTITLFIINRNGGNYEKQD